MIIEEKHMSPAATSLEAAHHHIFTVSVLCVHLGIAGQDRGSVCYLKCSDVNSLLTQVT